MLVLLCATLYVCVCVLSLREAPEPCMAWLRSHCAALDDLPCPAVLPTRAPSCIAHPFLRVAVLCFAVLRGRVATVPYLTEKQVPHSRAEQFNALLRTMRRIRCAKPVVPSLRLAWRF